MNTNKEEWVERFETWASGTPKPTKEQELADFKEFVREERAKVLDDYRTQLRERVEGKLITSQTERDIDSAIKGAVNNTLQEVLELINNN